MGFGSQGVLKDLFDFSSKGLTSKAIRNYHLLAYFVGITRNTSTYLKIFRYSLPNFAHTFILLDLSHISVKCMTLLAKDLYEQCGGVYAKPDCWCLLSRKW